MREVVLGTGQQTSVAKVVSIIEDELKRTQGVPRKVTARSEHAVVTAERETYEGDFLTYELRVRLDEADAAAFEREAGQLDGAMCKLSQDEGWHLLRIASADGATPPPAELLEKASGLVDLPEVWRVEGGKYRTERVSTQLLFKGMLKYKASDVHLAPGESPVFRIDNQTHRSELIPPLSGQQILALIRELTTEVDWEEFETSHQCSFNFHEVGLGYSRVSAFMKSGAPHLTMRFLPEQIPSFTDLNIPEKTMVSLASLHHGLVLVTGMTGSGKTTTVAALVDWINSHKQLHILAIENPIEYVHKNKKCVVSQRSLGPDVPSFQLAVTGALRHDPDVIVIGEMRDPDTIRSAINAAATGHLVISTLHANTASEVVNRIVSFFDPIERDLVRLQLRDAMRCVLCQRLVPKEGGGRVPTLEIMFADIKSIRDGIVLGDTDMIRVGMQQSVSHSFLFEEYMLRLVRQGTISVENARFYSTEVSVFDQMHMGTYSIPRVDALKAHH